MINYFKSDKAYFATMLPFYAVDNVTNALVNERMMTSYDEEIILLYNGKSGYNVGAIESIPDLDIF
jgi:hypothetical protein